MKERIKDRNIAIQFWKEREVNYIKKVESITVKLQTKGWNELLEVEDRIKKRNRNKNWQIVKGNNKNRRFANKCLLPYMQK